MYRIPIVSKPSALKATRDLVALILRTIFHREVDLLCGYLCYTTLLSLIPLITLFLIVGNLFGAHDRDTYTLAGRLLEMLTPESAAQLRSALSELYVNARLKRVGF